MGNVYHTLHHLHSSPAGKKPTGHKSNKTICRRTAAGWQIRLSQKVRQAESGKLIMITASWTAVDQVKWDYTVKWLWCLPFIRVTVWRIERVRISWRTFNVLLKDTSAGLSCQYHENWWPEGWIPFPLGLEVVRLTISMTVWNQQSDIHTNFTVKLASCADVRKETEFFFSL